MVLIPATVYTGSATVLVMIIYIIGKFRVQYLSQYQYIQYYIGK